MKRLLFVLSFIASCGALSGCMVTTTTPRVRVYEPPPPQLYVYAYPNGCWADGLWYSPCPWVVGPPYGYYSYGHGGYYHHPHVYWQYRPGHPPPAHWRHHRPARPHPARPPHPRHGPRRR